MDKRILIKSTVSALMVALCILWTGCSSDDKVEVPDLEIISEDLYFSSLGGEGVVKVKATSSVTATSSDEDWCTVSVSGTTVTVNVLPNSDVTSRTAKVTIKSGNETAEVAANQRGYAFGTSIQKLDFGWNDFTSTTVNFVSPIGITSVEYNADWLSYEIVNPENVYFEATRNTTGHRNVTVRVYSGDSYFDLPVSQVGGFAYADLLGSWTMTSINRSNVVQTRTVTFSGTDQRLITVGSIDGYDIDFTYDPDFMRMTVSAGQYLGTNGSNYVFTCMRDASAGSYTWGTSVQYEAIIGDDLSNPVFKFDDNGSWSNHVDGMYIYNFSSMTPSSSTAVSYINYYADMTFTKD